MIKEQARLLKRVLRVSDLFLVGVSFFVGYFIRDTVVNIYPINFLSTYIRDEHLRSVEYYVLYIGLLPVFLLIWGGLLSYFGMYKASYPGRISESLIIILKTTIVGFVLFGSYVFILRMQEDISRLFIGFTFVTAALLISVEKIVFVTALKILSRMDTKFKSALISFRRILIIGTGKRARTFIELIKNNPNWNIKIIGLIDMDIARKGKQ